MPNTLEKSQKYLDLILELYRKGSLTAPLDTQSVQFDPVDANVVKILRVNTTAMGNYVRDTGYPQGSVTTQWDSYTLAVDRGVKFMLDRLDEEEILAMTIGRAADEFTRDKMIPELDAYRFAKYYGGAGTKIAATLNENNILEAIDTAAVLMNNNEVPDDGSRQLFVNQNLELAIRKALNRVFANDSAINTRVMSYNGMNIVYVPASRFKTMIALNDGTGGEWGYTGGGNAINFILLDPKAVWQVTRAARGKFITADQNQNLDSNEFHFRICHDAGTITGKTIGVYANTAA